MTDKPNAKETQSLNFRVYKVFKKYIVTNVYGETKFCFLSHIAYELMLQDFMN